MHPELEITSLAYGGEGVGRLDGKVCFVENALPGERVRVKIVQNQKKILKARAVEILKSSPERQTPPCPHYNTCGGCQYQHLSYSEELHWKERQVQDYLSRQLQLNPEVVQPITGSSRAYEYRSSVTMHQSSSGRSGFIARDNRSVTAVEKCLLLDNRLQNSFARPWQHPNEKSRTFRLNLQGEDLESSKDVFFEIAVGKEKIITHSRCFFQNNLEITGKIGDKLQKWISNFSAETFIDLYCGVGTFTFLSAPNESKLLMAEENPWAIKALRKNLETRGRAAEILEGQVENKFSGWIQKQKLNRPFLFIDPPREGMHEKMALALSKLPEIFKMAYLSCHLGSLARDLKILIKDGSFKIESVYPFDMFPRTRHVETLVLLSKRP